MYILSLYFKYLYVRNNIIFVIKLIHKLKTHIPTPHRRDRIKMKPICIKGLKQRQSTPTPHAWSGEVYRVYMKVYKASTKALVSKP